MTKLLGIATAALSVALLPTCAAFAPTSTYLQTTSIKSASSMNMIPADLVTEVPTALLNAADITTTTASAVSSSNLLSFSDQGQNLAGIFFQASLLPYLGFIYFLSFRGNRTPNLGNFGWQYLLLFVLGTIPSGIITKSVYGQSLANTDWLHGGAEALLTVTNVLIVSMFFIFGIMSILLLFLVLFVVGRFVFVDLIT